MKLLLSGTSFIQRTLSGAVLLVLVLGGILLSVYSFGALLLVITAGCIWEFYRMAEKGGYCPQKKSGLVVSLLAVVSAFLAANDILPITSRYWGLFLLIILLAVFTVMAAELYKKRENAIGNVAVTVTGIVYAALPFTLLSFLPAYAFPSDKFIHAIYPTAGYDPTIILAYVVLVWSNDVFAYLAGITFGRHKLFERVSPKKSWEGFFGGLIATLAVGALMGWFSGYGIKFWTGLALVTVISGVYGDLVESMFKRSVDLKDSGSIMPGHGGFLDRFDAMIFSAPFVYVYFIIFAT